VDIDNNGFYPSLQLVTNPNDRQKMKGWTSIGTKKKQNDAGFRTASGILNFFF